MQLHKCVWLCNSPFSRILDKCYIYMHEFQCLGSTQRTADCFILMVIAITKGSARLCLWDKATACSLHTCNYLIFISHLPGITRLKHEGRANNGRDRVIMHKQSKCIIRGRDHYWHRPSALKCVIPGKCVLKVLLLTTWPSLTCARLLASKCALTGLKHGQVCNKRFKLSSGDVFCVIWLAGGHVISNILALKVSTEQSITHIIIKLHVYCRKWVLVCYHWVLSLLLGIGIIMVPR